jgi:hypothetical protein
MTSLTSRAVLPHTVRVLTPVFAYKIEGAESFTHAGTYKGADFKVDLRPYRAPPILRRSSTLPISISVIRSGKDSNTRPMALRLVTSF